MLNFPLIMFSFFFFSMCCFILTFYRLLTFHKCPIGTPTACLISDKTVGVVVDLFVGNAEFFFNVFQYRMLEIFWDDNYFVGFNHIIRNKTLRRLDKYAFLFLSTLNRGWIRKFSYPILYLSRSALQDNPAISTGGTFCSEEKSHVLVGCKVYQIGFTSKVLNSKANFKFICLINIVFCLFQFSFFNFFYATV